MFKLQTLFVFSIELYGQVWHTFKFYFQKIQALLDYKFDFHTLLDCTQAFNLSIKSSI